MFKNQIIAKSGFTIMELMIVMAIIGILAATLIPGVSSYLIRGRDSERISDINELSRGLVGYFGTYDKYPGAINCDLSAFVSAFVSPDTNIDPYSNRNHGCGDTGIYGYGSGFINAQHFFSMSAYMENPQGGYYNATGSNNPFTGDLISSDLSLISSMVKGSGPLYVLSQ